MKIFPVVFSAQKESGLRGYRGGWYTSPHLSLIGTKSGVGIAYSPCLGIKAASIPTPKGPATKPLAIGCCATLTGAVVIVAVSCIPTAGLGTATQVVASAEGSGSQAP